MSKEPIRVYEVDLAGPQLSAMEDEARKQFDIAFDGQRWELTGVCAELPLVGIGDSTVEEWLPTQWNATYKAQTPLMRLLALGKGAYMARTTYCPRCGLERVTVGPFGDCTRCLAPGFISDPRDAEYKRRQWRVDSRPFYERFWWLPVATVAIVCLAATGVLVWLSYFGPWSHV